MKRMRSRWLKAVAVTMVGGLLSGCATIFSGPSQAVKITSQPEAATVKVDGKICGKTPLTTDIKRAFVPTIRLELDGHQPYEVVLDQELNPWIWANILNGGIIGLLIDMQTGAAVDLVPGEVDVQLEKLGSEAAKPSIPAFLTPPPAGKTLVCFYRKKKFAGSAAGWTVWDGTRQIVTLRNGAYAYYFAEPGARQLRTNFGGVRLTKDSFTKEVTFAAGEVRYFRAELGGPITEMPAHQAVKEIETGGLQRN